MAGDAIFFEQIINFRLELLVENLVGIGLLRVSDVGQDGDNEKSYAGKAEKSN